MPNEKHNTDIIKPDNKISKYNKTWESNHEKIEEAYQELLENSNKIPTLKQIAEKCGLHTNTIHKHLREMKVFDVTPKQKLRAQKILNALSVKAEDGDVKAMRLYFELVMEWQNNKNSNPPTTGRTIKIEWTDNTSPVIPAHDFEVIGKDE